MFSTKNTITTEFYFDFLHHLLNGRLKNSEVHYNLYLAQRGNNSIHRFEEAVKKTLVLNDTKKEATINYKLEIVPSKEMPELSIIDYLIWAVQRKLLKNESRYFDALQDKFETLIHLYEEKI